MEGKGGGPRLGLVLDVNLKLLATVPDRAEEGLLARGIPHRPGQRVDLRIQPG